MLLLLLPAGARAATPGDAPVALNDYLGELAAARQRVAACAQTPDGCKADGFPAEQRITRGAAGGFRVSWQWLADTLGGAKAASGTDRQRAMHLADAHLERLAAEAQVDPGAAVAASFASTRLAANKVLARPEFRAAAGPGWWQLRLAQIQDWLFRLLSGVSRVGAKLPWLATLIEWSCFGLAAAGLLWSLWRSLARQALQISLTEAGALTGWTERDVADWRQAAERAALAGEWRLATHNLYWAGIAVLESRRAWRPNSTRTPREYLRLLQPGSEAEAALRELTRSLEAVWYGQAASDARQYQAALASFERLERARSERAAAVGSHASQRAVSAAGSA